MSHEITIFLDKYPRWVLRDGVALLMSFNVSLLSYQLNVNHMYLGAQSRSLNQATILGEKLADQF